LLPGHKLFFRSGLCTTLQQQVLQSPQNWNNVPDKISEHHSFWNWHCFSDNDRNNESHLEVCINDKDYCRASSFNNNRLVSALLSCCLATTTDSSIRIRKQKEHTSSRDSSGPGEHRKVRATFVLKAKCSWIVEVGSSISSLPRHPRFHGKQVLQHSAMGLVGVYRRHLHAREAETWAL
jgi:hypothetical protein